jgi:hypothetical protein
MIFKDDTPGGIAMVHAPAHHLSAGVVKDDHIVLEVGDLIED